MHVRVVAPSSSAATLPAEVLDRAVAMLGGAGHRVTWGANVRELDVVGSSPVAARVEDLHAAWADDSVDVVMAVRGGFASNQLLPHLDWDLAARTRAVTCGFSDVTALCGGLLTAAGRWAVLGPVLASFGTTTQPDRCSPRSRPPSPGPSPPRSPRWRGGPTPGPATPRPGPVGGGCWCRAGPRARWWAATSRP